MLGYASSEGPHLTWPSQEVANRWLATGLKCRLLTVSAGGEFTSMSLFGLAAPGEGAADPDSVPKLPPKDVILLLSGAQWLHLSQALLHSESKWRGQTAVRSARVLECYLPGQYLGF